MRSISSLFLLLLASCGIASAQAPQFKAQVIDNQIDIGYGLAIGDVDGDNRPDILLADKKEIVWYKNPGKRGLNWTRYVMAANLTQHDNVCIAAHLINGQLEVAVGAQWNPSETKNIEQSGAVFYLKRPADPTQLWIAVQLPHEVTIHRMTWITTAQGKHKLIVLPLHGLNNSNGEGAGVNLMSFNFPEDMVHPGKVELLNTNMHMTHNLQYQGGKNSQLAIAGKEGVRIFEQSNGKWKATEDWLSKNHPAGEIQTGKLKNTLFTATVEPMHGNQLAVTTKTDRKVLTDNMGQGHALTTGDYLKLGYDQVVVGWRNPNRDKKVGVRLFVPKDHTGSQWEQHVLDESILMACEDLKSADLDGDGKLDIIASGRATLNVLVYWNDNK